MNCYNQLFAIACDVHKKSEKLLLGFLIARSNDCFREDRDKQNRDKQWFFQDMAA